MSDLIERLRDQAPILGGIAHEAADHIEDLRAEAAAADGYVKTLEAENDRLRDALEEILDLPSGQADDSHVMQDVAREALGE